MARLDLHLVVDQARKAVAVKTHHPLHGLASNPNSDAGKEPIAPKNPNIIPFKSNIYLNKYNFNQRNNPNIKQQ